MVRDNIMDTITDDFTPHQPAPRRRMTKVSLLNNGRWMFILPDSLGFKKIDDYNESARSVQSFALLLETENDPSKGSFYGGRGDYIVRDKFGNLTTFDEQTYLKMFPQ